jgi:hypothetical protein
MTTAYSTLLGLALPVQGELSGTWGDTVDNGITRYLDIAVAGTVTLTNDGAVTLSLTNGDASATNIVSSLTGAGTTSAQFAIIRVTGTLTVAKVLTAPSSSRTYVVVNAATGSTVTVKASGQTGVSIAVGETAFVYFNGTDYAKIVGTATAGAAGGSTTQVQYNNAGVLAGITGATTNGTALTLVAPNLGSPATVGTMPAFTLGGTVSGGGNQINNVVIGAVTPLAGSFTTLDASSTVTLSGGTANGVAYLNGSKVLTTGTALVFDGTNLGVGGTGDPFGRFYGRSIGLSSASGAFLELNAASGSTSGIDFGANATRTAGITSNATETNFTTLGATPILFGINSAEAMRLTSTSLYTASTINVGIGTSSPITKLQANKSSQTPGSTTPSGALLISNTVAGNGCLEIGNDSSANGWIQSRNTTSATFYGLLLQPGGGNVGIGTSSPNYLIDSQTTSTSITTNLKVNAAAAANNYAEIAFQLWSGAGSGLNTFGGSGTSRPSVVLRGLSEGSSAAGAFVVATFSGGATNAGLTEKMRLDSAGNLGLGVTPSAWAAKALQIGNASNSGWASIGYDANGKGFFATSAFNDTGSAWKYTATGFAATLYSADSGAHKWFTAPSGTAGNAISFTQAMTLDASGNLGIGPTLPAYRLDVSVGTNTIAQQWQGAGTGFTLCVKANDGSALNASAYRLYLDYLGGAATNGFIDFYRGGGGGDGYLAFGASGTERARIDSSGNLLVGASTLAFAEKMRVYGNYSVFDNGTFTGFIGSGSSLGTGTATDFAIRSSNALAFLTGGGTERARINSSGNLGVGTTNCYERFSVVAATNPTTAATSNQIAVGEATDNYNYRMSMGYGFLSSAYTGVLQATAGGNGCALVINPLGGNVGIGTTSTAFTGKVVTLQATSASDVFTVWNSATTGDNAFIGFYTDAGGTGRGSITYNRAGGLVAYNQTSDYRAKDISGPVTGSGALIDSVPVYMGKMKDATQERPMFIAHEVPAYAHTGVKDAVDADGNPVYQQMDASALIPVMWAEIQSLRKRLAAAGIA